MLRWEGRGAWQDGEGLTHKRRKTLDLGLFGDDEATAPLLPGRLACDGDGVLWTGAETIVDRIGSGGDLCTGVGTKLGGAGAGDGFVYLWTNDDDGRGSSIT
jgi:hypothetical protein